jgi:hypothetical protein
LQKTERDAALDHDLEGSRAGQADGLEVVALFTVEASWPLGDPVDLMACTGKHESQAGSVRNRRFSHAHSMELYFLDDASIAMAPSDSSASDKRIEARDGKNSTGERQTLCH